MLHVGSKSFCFSCHEQNISVENISSRLLLLAVRSQIWVSQNFMSLAFSISQMKPGNQSPGDSTEWHMPPSCRQRWLWVQAAYTSSSPPLPQKMSRNPRWRSSMSEVAEKCIRPWDGTYVYCIIDKDRRCWDHKRQKYFSRTEGSFCLLWPPNRLLFLLSCPSTLSSFSVGRETILRGWILLILSQVSQSTAILCLSSRESSAQQVSAARAETLLVKEQKSIQQNCLMPEHRQVETK